MPTIPSGSLVVFGDSASDVGTGSFYSMNGLTFGWGADAGASFQAGSLNPLGGPTSRAPAGAPYPPAHTDINQLYVSYPHFYGRFSDGPVWSEHVAELLQLPLRSYAVGGAHAGRDDNWCPAAYLRQEFKDAHRCPIVPSLAG